MFGPWIEIYVWFKSVLPQRSKLKLRRPHFNFITIHYCYMLGMTIIGSIILYPKKNIAYIDCLFFASGASTQSGLNTVNINELYLYQQVVLLFIACISNPIFINTVVVFIRLYWFEKRFQNIVLEAQRFRRTREKTRTVSEGKTEADVDSVDVERGIGDREIHVIRPSEATVQTASAIQHDRLANKEPLPSDENRSGDSDESTELNDGTIVVKDFERIASNQDEFESLPFKKNITFVEPPRPQREPTLRDSAGRRLPVARSHDQNIAFVEKQRQNEGEGDTLYIPGPREFDRGDKPVAVAEDKMEMEMIHDTAEPGTPEPGSPELGTPRRVAFKGTDLDPDADELVLDHDGVNGGSHMGPFGDAYADAFSIKRKKTNHSFLDNSAVRSVTRTIMHPWSQDNKSTEHSKENLNIGSGLRHRGRTATFTSFLTNRSEADRDPMPYLSYQPTIGRNSAFVNLNEEQRNELGGIEYRALKTLAVILCCYFFGWMFVAIISYTPWILKTNQWRQVVQSDGINSTWWGIFTACSMFTDLGFTLTPDSMQSFQYAIWPLLLGSFLIIIGNTGFPCMLRFTIWIMSKLVPSGSSIWEELRFLLDHPRRCFTLLFPSRATWWLFWVLVLLNGTDLIFFIILDLNDPVVSDLPPGIRVLNGWFQAASTRTAGFGIVNLAYLHPAIQVSYLIMMYISVFPIAISVRNTNVYEEKSLGVYSDDPPPPVDETDENGNPITNVNNASYVGSHLRRQLSFDLWYIFLGLFVIAIVEGGQIQDLNKYAFTIFSCLFEVVSAYGTVGLSLGYPNTDPSFSAQFHVLSKLVIIAMQIRGRHRGLPYALDKAILLPSEGLAMKEQEELNRRRKRTPTMATTTSANSGVTSGDYVLENGGTTSSQREAGILKTRTTTDDLAHAPTLQSTASSKNTYQSAHKGIKRLISSALSAGPTVGRKEFKNG